MVIGRSFWDGAVRALVGTAPDFTSAKAVSRASLADLAAIPGISGQTAQIVYDHFNRS